MEEERGPARELLPGAGDQSTGEEQAQKSSGR